MLIVVPCFGHVLMYCLLIVVTRRIVSEESQYQYPEQPSSEQFEQQPEQYEEGKYNMNNLSL